MKNSPLFQQYTFVRDNRNAKTTYILAKKVQKFAARDLSLRKISTNKAKTEDGKNEIREGSQMRNRRIKVIVLKKPMQQITVMTHIQNAKNIGFRVQISSHSNGMEDRNEKTVCREQISG